MNYAITYVKDKLAEAKDTVADYKKWIAEAKAEGNQYAVDEYTEEMKEWEDMIPDLKEALEVLNGEIVLTKRYGKHATKKPKP